MKNLKKLLMVCFVGGLLICVALASRSMVSTTDVVAQEAGQNRLEKYFPNTEKLGAEEMRGIACGTGMPAQRRSQAATCFLVELGNGDKFIFDIGSGSGGNLGCPEMPYDYLDKYSSATSTRAMSVTWQPYGLAVGPVAVTEPFPTRGREQIIHPKSSGFHLNAV